MQFALTVCQIVGQRIILKLSSKPLKLSCKSSKLIYLFDIFFRKQKRSATSLPGSFFGLFLKENVALVISC